MPNDPALIPGQRNSIASSAELRNNGPGDYDGDGYADVAVYRPSSGHWFILTSTTNYTTSATYQGGATGDIPVLRRP